MISIHIVLAVFFAAGCNKQETSLIRVKGSTTVDPITKKVAQVFQSRSNIRVEVEPSGSHFGLEALINGECDIAASSSEAPVEYLEKAEKAGVVLKRFLIAHDDITPIVHPSNSAETISLRQLRDIYSGRITTWKKITKQKETILVVGRDDSSGTADIWKNVLGLKGDIRKDKIAKGSNSGVLAFVAENENALGYISAAFLNSEVKALTVRNVSNDKNAGDIPNAIYRNLYFYVNENKFSKDSRSFIIFILSSEGQRLIKELGFTPS